MYKKSHKLFSIVLVLALILSMGGTVFATSSPEDGTVVVQSVGSTAIDFNRTSPTQGETIIAASTYTVATYITATVTLQEYSNGTWITAKGVSTTTQTQTEYNSSGFYMVSNWDLTAGKNYRIRAVIKDKCGSVTSTTTEFSNAN